MDTTSGSTRLEIRKFLRRMGEERRLLETIEMRNRIWVGHVLERGNGRTASKKYIKEEGT